VVSDTDLSIHDNTWKCWTVDELEHQARVVYWGIKLFQWIKSTIPPA
jgi:hypothetical protein